MFIPLYWLQPRLKYPIIHVVFNVLQHIQSFYVVGYLPHHINAMLNEWIRASLARDKIPKLRSLFVSWTLVINIEYVRIRFLSFFSHSHVCAVTQSSSYLAFNCQSHLAESHKIFEWMLLIQMNACVVLMNYDAWELDV